METVGRIILMRHARTFANAARVFDTRPPGAELTVLGRLQATEAGVHLANITHNLGGVVASVAIRTQQTAVAAVKAYEETLGLPADTYPIDVDPNLREVFSGALEGSSAPESHEAYIRALDAWMSGDLYAAMPEGETANEVVIRMRKPLEDLATLCRETGKDYLAVSHGAAIRIATRYSSDVPENVARNIYVGNTSLMIIEPCGEFGQWHCEMWGSTRLDRP
ncbi:histidine phosphatase family protein [Corynebacterium pseudotuberculosis]|uniref:Histidine phosphatase family protein n=1 Tax=Corynebacterium pseudotuberculosis (strain C231) TaxID=681645 RepID=D9QCZ7_CORP2|nr:histidine phosphatase family protein [Corynebacterium pseudotuberculosis]ADK29775.1 histidine phosphatase family protein [Corynebacterium pseudotuberculosis FRC41]ADL11423.2 histidine phosphatase family protein [Corynebacterium pseudotuberculosis C231]ADL21835.1 histidine phosphatase family protein [Corynebacterium pseudotuberculosis 1002]ADO27233.1 histidine phosphatase family protein [Corynebacterium pseudotuberculosis I19]AEK93293.1 Phosphoglycerate mutase [Corynebacterium pseudotubercul